MTFSQKFVLALLPSWLLMSGCEPSRMGTLQGEKDPLFMQAMSRKNGGDIEGAVELLERAIEANPRNASAHLELGLIDETPQNDYAAAIYHLGKYLQLRPSSPQGEIVKEHILACKQELAKTVLPASLPQTAERELMALSRKNEELLHELESLRLQNANLLVALSNRASQVVPQRPEVEPPRQPVLPGGGGSRRPAEPAQNKPAMRIHVVAKGDTLSSLSRRYDVPLERIRAANPGVNERRLQVGQRLNVPVR